MTSFIRSLAPVALTCSVVAVFGCNRDRAADGTTTTTTRTEPGTTTITGANVVANKAAVTRIADARCARELACNNIGADKRYSSQQFCIEKIGVDMKDDLNAQDCPRGIDQKELNECLAEIRNESCNNPIDKLERLAACRTSDMCLKTNAPNR